VSQGNTPQSSRRSRGLPLREVEKRRSSTHGSRRGLAYAGPSELIDACNLRRLSHSERSATERSAESRYLFGAAKRCSMLRRSHARTLPNLGPAVEDGRAASQLDAAGSSKHQDGPCLPRVGTYRCLATVPMLRNACLHTRPTRQPGSTDLQAEKESDECEM
jgi:hypothetical protein